METVIFIGVQASGKSTFFHERFENSHVRINLDMLRTRHREKLLIDACLEGKQPHVIDNTNPTKEDRAKYIPLAKSKGFRVVGYYFASKVDDCKLRNEQRGEDEQIPLAGLLGTYNRLQLPQHDEGFDALYYVSIADDGSFNIDEWNDEV
ncbi:MAG: ATP-binding protein [Planctomycetota bacterium]|nr:MAG: ATP-binding protein [Planctomycetota bacterium]REJ86928.1 MAG: ATP-binding protein [Planctomycetota bacterium]REK24945.1 MAG: ATP-binding protein [Planctomycetota bacterium]REK48534.1 MAG: ATP-binding protein [Planctomycetota bacterium]